MENQNLSPLKKIVRISFFSLFFLSFTHSVFAVNYNVSGYTSIGSQGEININGNGGDTVIVGVTSGSRAFIQAIPASGYTFSSWSDSFAGQSSMINTVVTGTLSGTASFVSAPTSIMSINNKCVSRIVTYNVTSAKALNGSTVSASKAQVYILEGSTFSSPVQDVSGYLPQSPNQSFYYAFNASTVGAGIYLGSNTAFSGSTNYLSLGSATVTSDVHYSCVSAPVTRYTVTTKSNLPSTVTAVISGAGTYNNHSNVTITAPAVSNYKFVSFSGNCGAGVTGYDGAGPSYSFLYPISASQSVYSYVLSDIQSSCYVLANYIYTPPAINKNYTINVTADPNGTVTLDGNTGGNVSGTYPAGTQLTVTANPASGYNFYSWTEDFYGQSSTYTFTLNKDINTLATFASSTVVAGTGTTGASAPTLVIDAYPYSSSGYFTISNVSYSFPWTLGQGGGGTLYEYDTDSFYMPTPVANLGYVFTGWFGNVATSTLDKMNSGSIIYARELKGIINPKVYANFVFNGQTSSGQNANTFTEVLAVSPTGVLDSSLQASNINSNGTFEPSPYTFDGKCVEKVIKFKAKRVNFSMFNRPLFAGDLYTYTLYGINSSSFSGEKSGSYIHSFKSDPSPWILRASNDNSDLPSGSYSSTASSTFSSAQVFDFSAYEHISILDYSCSSADIKSSSIKPYYMSLGFNVPFIKGINYKALFGTSLVNDITNEDNSLWNLGIDNYKSQSYLRFQCEQGTINTRIGSYCSSWLGEETTKNWNQYKYMWIFSTHKMKGFIHQELSNFVEVSSGADQVWGFMYFPSVSSVLVSGDTDTVVKSIPDYEYGTVGTSTNRVKESPFYATKIDLTNCRYYEYLSDFPDTYTDCLSSITSFSVASGTMSGSTQYNFNYSSNLVVNYPKKLNSLFVDVAQSYDGDVLYYGGLLSSDNTFNVVENENIHYLLSKRVQRGVINPQDFFEQEKATNFDDDVFDTATSSVCSTSTIDGYYDAPVYHATTTGASVFNATNTIAWIPFASSTQDYTGNRTLTAQNGTSFCTTYMASSSACFDGSNDYVSMSTGFNLSGINWSVEQDIYLTSVSGDRAVIDQSDGSTNSGSSYHFEVSGGYMKLWLMYGSTSSTFSGTYLLSANTLYKIRYTYDGSNVRFYVNGSLKDTFSFSQTINNTGTPSIGSLAGSYWFTSGGVRNVYIANIATTTPFPLMTVGTINGYYDAPVYHATSTSYGCVTATTTINYKVRNNATSSGFYSDNGLFTFSGDSFSGKLDGLSIGFSSISDMKSKLLSEYSLDACLAGADTIAKSFSCVLLRGPATVLIHLLVPSASQILMLQDGLTNVVTSGNGMFSLIFTIPLRFNDYADLDCPVDPSCFAYNASSSKLTFGFSSSSQIIFTPPTTTPFSASDKAISNVILPFMHLALGVIVSMLVVGLFL